MQPALKVTSDPMQIWDPKFVADTTSTLLEHVGPMSAALFLRRVKAKRTEVKNRVHNAILDLEAL